MARQERSTQSWPPPYPDVVWVWVPWKSRERAERHIQKMGVQPGLVFEDGTPGSGPEFCCFYIRLTRPLSQEEHQQMQRLLCVAARGDPGRADSFIEHPSCVKSWYEAGNAVNPPTMRK